METNLPVSRALEFIRSRAVVLPAERVALREARGRVLREDACADEDSPRFDCSAMDGYAFRREDGSERLEVIGEVQAGTEVQLEISAGQCARIFTGARIPDGADCVVMQEETRRDGDFIQLTRDSGPSHIRKRGENSQRGDVVVAAGAELRVAELAALASCGVTHPLVTRRARVIHLVTGDELIDPAETPRGTQLRDSNSTLVASFFDAVQAELVRHERLPDSLEVSKQIAGTLGNVFDLLLVSGGASVGAYDFARPMLEHAGFRIEFQNVNLRPGKPLALYTRGDTLAFAVPGNPVSHWVILNLFIAPLLAAMSGRSLADTRLIGRVTDDVTQKPNPRETHVPAIATMEAGEFRLQPRRFVSSGDVASVAGANALLEIPADLAGFRAGDQAKFIFCQ